MCCSLPASRIAGVTLPFTTQKHLAITPFKNIEFFAV
jgi:hypothetical protein